MDDDLRRQFRDLGAIVPAGSDEDEEHIAVMAANWPSLEAFLACSTQWRVTAVTMGTAAGVVSQLVWLGLDYTACDVVLRARNAPAHVLSDLMAMEDAALPILNEAN